MSTYELTMPVSDSDIKKLKAGDVIFITGTIVTGRDDVHHRVVKQNKKFPLDISGKAIFHAGPIMKKNDDGSYKLVAVGPTTSMRMEACEAEFLAETGVKIIIGKGGMGPKTTKGCVDNCAVHTIFPGGCAIIAAEEVTEVKGVEWLDLGMPEAAWILEGVKFGPLIVSIDSYGNNLIDENKALFQERKGPVVERISKKLDFLE